MRRRSIPALPLTLVITLALVLAGCVQPVPGSDGTAVTPQSTDAPPLPPASPSSEEANGSNATWAPDVEACVDEVTEPSFDSGTEVNSRSEPVPANVTHAVVRVGSYLGGVYVAPWTRDNAQVEVGESDPDDILEPRVNITTRGSTLIVNVEVERTGAEERGPLGVDLFTEQDTYAAVKVRIPDLPVESLSLRDMPERDGSDGDPVVWFRTDWSHGGWGEVIAHDLEVESFASKAHVLDTTVVRVRATAAAVSAGSGDVHMHRFAARNASVEGGSSELCASLVHADALHLDNGSGDVEVRGVDAHRLAVETGAGDISVEKVRARSASLDVGSGDLTLGHVLFQRLRVDTGSGSVDGALEPLATGNVEVNGGSGDVTLRFPAGPDLGYMVRADAGSGDVNVTITNGTVEESGQDRGGQVTGRTRGFSERPIQVQVAVSTGSGDILVEA